MIKLSKWFKNMLGPGFLIAATGVGAGDMIAATAAGARYGYTILWACAVGALFKYFLNEGIARWQAATNSTLIHGWVTRFHSAISAYFMVYLFLWGFIVSAALMAGCGLVAHSIFPQLSIGAWGILHAIIAAVLVLKGKYRILENIMKVVIAIMFSTVIINLFLIDIDWRKVTGSLLIPKIPNGAIELILGVIGGVGGSVTMLCYNYWVKEKGWNSATKIKSIKIDLKIAYFLTGLFGMAIIIISSTVHPDVVSGNKIIIGLADKLGETAGIYGKWIFMIGFWGAVFSSMLGVWDGVPYLFNDLVVSYKEKYSQNKIAANNTIKSGYYLWFLAYLVFPPMLLLFLGKPVWIIILYAIVGSFFMPFLAMLLLIMNTKSKWVKNFKNKWFTNLILITAILLFFYLFFMELKELF